jgi:ankyrin repeat protein
MGSLHYATKYNNHEVSKTLIENGANLCTSYGNIFGITPLYFAVDNRMVGIVQMIADRSSDLNQPTNSGYTPLHNAIDKGSISIAKILLENGANVNVQLFNNHLIKKGYRGFTPLHLATMSGNQQLVELLLEHNANITIKSVEGKTPLDLARENGFSKVCNIINSYGNRLNNNYDKQDSSFGGSFNSLQTLETVIQRPAGIPHLAEVGVLTASIPVIREMNFEN